MSWEDGVRVVRLPSFRAPQSRLLPRMWESFSFGRSACDWLAREFRDVDVVYANTKPLLSQAVIARHCKRNQIPLVWHIKDLYPESIQGKLSRWTYDMVSPPLVALDRWIVHQALQTVVLSDGWRRVYLDSRRLPADRVTTILDWVDEKGFEHLPARAQACSKYGVAEDRFTFLYLGNIGPVAGVEFLIEAFHAAKLPRAQLVIAGDGSAKAGCVAMAKRLGVARVQFVSDPSAANVSLLQSLGHVCLLPLRKGAGLSSIPSKLMAYLLSAKPVLATLDEGSDTARCVREAECGWVGEPEQIAWLAERMRAVSVMPAEELTAMGERGRAFGLRHFSKAAGVQRLAGIVLSAAGRSPVIQHLKV